MAVSKVHGQDRLAYIAGVDLSDHLFYAAKIEDGKLVLAGAGETPLGAIYETAPLGRPATVAFGALVNFVAGAAIASGEAVAVAADGRLAPAGTAAGFGIAVKAAAEGEVLEVVLGHAVSAASGS